MNKHAYLLYLDLATKLLNYTELQRGQIFEIVDIHLLQDDDENILLLDYLEAVSMASDFLDIAENIKIKLCNKLKFLLENYTCDEKYNLLQPNKTCVISNPLNQKT